MTRAALFVFLAACASSSAAPRVAEDTPPGALPESDGGTAEASVDSAPPADAADPKIDEKALDAFFATQMVAARVPGMALAIVKHGAIVWEKAYGSADLDAGRPVTVDTLFLLASISKTFVGVALMQLFERGSFRLDDDVNAKLPFAVRNPRFPNVPITYRMLLTHTSSLLDGDGLSSATFPGDAPTPLSTWISSYVTPGGASYAANNWSTSAPGTAYQYSNAGASLAGDLVEAISGMNLQEYCKTNVFLPLGMTESSWFFAGLDATHIAMPYEVVNGAFKAQGHYGFVDYPDGQLRTSAHQLARYLTMFMEFGQLGGTQVLSKPTVVEMRREQFPMIHGAEGQGLIWYTQQVGTTSVLGHAGAYLGASTDMWFDPVSDVGYVLLTNGGTYYDHSKGAAIDAMNAMNAKLLAIGHKL